MMMGVWTTNDQGKPLSSMSLLRSNVFSLCSNVVVSVGSGLVSWENSVCCYGTLFCMMMVQCVSVIVVGIRRESW